MDTGTVVGLLAVQLLCSGLLLYSISRRVAQRSGLGTWAASLVLFGLAFVVRLVDDPHEPAMLTLPADIAMVAALLLGMRGMRQFVGKLPRRPGVIAWVVAYGLLHLGLSYGLGTLARFVELNLTVGLLYLFFAWMMWAESRQRPAGDTLRRPLVTLGMLLAGAGCLTILRAAQLARHGVFNLFEGRFAQAYFLSVSVFGVVLSLLLLWLVFARLNQQLVELASRDALTRVLNRNGLDDVLTRHFGARDAAPLTVLLIDIDQFKRINDQQGHEAGDAALRAVSAVLTQHVRGNDFVVRTGGDEFLVGCVGTSAPAALALGERLRQDIAQLRVPWPGAIAPLRCTVSVGVSAPVTERGHWTHAVRQADRALYVAKSNGRDRVVSIDGIET